MRGRLVQSKEPLSSDVFEKSAINANGNSPLVDLPFLVNLLLGYASFVQDIPIYKDNVSANIPKRKKDQYREGHTIMRAKSEKSTCLVITTSRTLINYLESPFCPLVRFIIKSKSKE